MTFHVAQSTFIAHDQFDKEIIIEKGTVLESYDPFSPQEADSDKSFYLPTNYHTNVSTIVVPPEIIRKNLINKLDLYQEQFAHLDKNDLYFGQLNLNSSFELEKDHLVQHYQKIGEYITSEGIKYNAIQLPPEKDYYYWEPSDREDYEDISFVYIPEETLITKNHSFYYDLDKMFNPPNFIEIDKEVIKYPDMINIIDKFISKQKLTKEEELVYEDYSDHIRYLDEMFCGTDEKLPWDKLIQEIKEKHYGFKTPQSKNLQKNNENLHINKLNTNIEKVKIMENLTQKETKQPEIKIGDWIKSEHYGEAVCIGLEKEWIQLRYHAIRTHDKKEIWVENGEHRDYITFVKSTDETAQYVLTLKGPYGEGETKLKKKY